MSIESIVPMIPLVALITINMMVMGKVVGFIISWFFTVLGCIMSYWIFRKGLGKRFDMFTENKEKIKKYRTVLRNIPFSTLVLIIAMPLTPAFIVNIVCGLIKMDFKKYVIALMIGKISMVYCLGFFGSSFVANIKNPVMLVKIGIIMVIIYGGCYIINRFLKLD